MTNGKILQIGLGKTGTSLLQKHVFPSFCADHGIAYWGNESEESKQNDRSLTTLIAHNLARLKLGKEVTPIDILKPTLISAEGFSSYRDCSRIGEYADKTREIFGRDTHILLTIRDPLQWFESLYVQLCIHENPVQHPESFFLSDEKASIHLPNPHINLSKFSYTNMIGA